ncbi:MAG: thiamine phosphate synthase [Gemmatimonadetes bacterium]|nr:thiamine phosphate synthase [Gemmatimonadota bacterium]
MGIPVEPGRPLGGACFIADVDTLGEDLVGPARPLLAAGLPAVLLRARGRAARDVVRIGSALRDAAGEAGAAFVVNGDLDAALALEADGVHIPAAGPGVAAVRARLPDGIAVGRSAHDEAEVVLAAGADWVFVSPVFATESKPGAPTLGPDALAALVARARPPVYALGGIDARNVAECRSAGVAGVAAIRAFAGPEGVAFLRAALESSPREGA